MSNIRKALSGGKKVLQAVDLKTLAGERVYFKPMNALDVAENQAWLDSLDEDTVKLAVTDVMWRARIIASSVCDSKGVKIYTKSEEDLKEVALLDADVFAELFIESARLAGLIPKLEEIESEVAQEAKNSETSSEDSSTS